MTSVNPLIRHVTMAGEPFADTLAFFVDELDMRMLRISPADDPSIAILQGHDTVIRLDKNATAKPQLYLTTGEAPSVSAPNGVEVYFIDDAHDQDETVDNDKATHETADDFVVDPSAEPIVPDLEPELVITNASNGSSWVTGRAGMRYRDLIPSRLGGRYIASHIEVCDGGPVPDLVHHHAIRFQMIFCHQGWVEVLYEDQGESFRMNAGDCVLQPPHIRHRVLASSAGAKVVELGCPADHDTFFDYDLELPTSQVVPNRLFGGQQFVRHQADQAEWEPSTHAGFSVQHTAIEQATSGLAQVRVLKPLDQVRTAPLLQTGEFWFLFVLEGSADFAVDGATAGAPLETGDSVTIPAGTTWCLRNVSADLKLLEVVVD